MRELIAKGVALLTLVVVIALSYFFASRRSAGARAGTEVALVTVAPTEPNRVTPPTPPTAPEPVAVAGQPPAAEERGRVVFEAQGCATCHAIGGVGSPRYPLDGVGARRSPAELREWILGTGAAATKIPTAILRRKQRYQQLPAEDLDALVTYLAGLKVSR